MDKFYAFLSKVFLLAGLIAFILAGLAKAFGFAYAGLFPLSYLRFTAICLLFVIAISLYQAAPQKPKQKKKKR